MNSENTQSKNVTPWRCLVGATISGTLAIALYRLTSAIAGTYATMPINTTNAIAARISVAVRTLVVGMASLGTGVFGLVAIGLVALGIQLSFQSLKQGFSKKENKIDQP